MATPRTGMQMGAGNQMGNATQQLSLTSGEKF